MKQGNPGPAALMTRRTGVIEEELAAATWGTTKNRLDPDPALQGFDLKIIGVQTLRGKT